SSGDSIAKAKAKYKYPWWASDDPVEVFWGQVNEEIQIVPSEKYHGCAQEAMGRVLFKSELSDAQALIDEFLARVPQATAEALLAKIPRRDRKSTRLNSSHVKISYAVFCLKKKKNKDKSNS